MVDPIKSLAIGNSDAISPQLSLASPACKAVYRVYQLSFGGQVWQELGLIYVYPSEVSAVTLRLMIRFGLTSKDTIHVVPLALEDDIMIDYLDND